MTLTVIVTDAARFSLTPKPTVVVVARCTGFTVVVPVRVSFGAGSVGFGVGVGVTGGVELFDVIVTVLFAGVGSTSAKLAVAVSET